MACCSTTRAPTRWHVERSGWRWAPRSRSPTPAPTDLPAALDELRVGGFTTVALSAHHETTLLDELATRLRDVRVAMLVGSERVGLSDATLARCDHKARIPMHAGVDSLNAANAAAIACYVLRPS